MNDYSIGLILGSVFVFIGIVLLIVSIARKFFIKRNRIFCVVGGIIFVILGGIALFTANQERLYYKPFELVFSDSVVNDTAPKNFTSTGDKMIVYDRTDKVFTTSWISSDMLAETPEEVKIIVLLEKRRQRAGEYTNGVIAYTQHYDLKFVDCETWEKIAQKSFEGGPRLKLPVGALALAALQTTRKFVIGLQRI